jgi:hypothetical protein
MQRVYCGLMFGGIVVSLLLSTNRAWRFKQLPIVLGIDVSWLLLI